MTSADLLLESRTATVKKIAASYGFDECRVAKADYLFKEADYLEKWLAKGLHGEMKYMENYFAKRVDPRELVPGAKSVIVLAQNYFPEDMIDSSNLQISKYAYGKDYHEVIRAKLKKFLFEMQLSFGSVSGRGYVDSAPVLEKAWAQRAGIGWQGKHTNIISKSKGSFFFLAVLVVDIELSPDGPAEDYCGTCTRCIDACPTNAITEPYKLDASKCISYYTIELKAEALPTSAKGKFENWIFGCDICQDVCPWNRFSKPHSEIEFQPKPGLLEMKKKDWDQLKLETFENLFSKSAVKRTGFSGLTRNISFVNLDS